MVESKKTSGYEAWKKQREEQAPAGKTEGYRKWKDQRTRELVASKPQRRAEAEARREEQRRQQATREAQRKQETIARIRQRADAEQARLRAEKEGLAKYEADRKTAALAEQEKPWWQKMAEDTVDNEFRLLPGVNVHGIAQDFERDTSYQEMDDRWDEKHRQEFGYRYAQDPEDARDYAAGYNDYLNRLEKQKKMEALAQEAVDKPWLSTAKAIGAQALGGFGEYVNDVAENLGRGRITERGTDLSSTEYAGTVTGAISEDLNRKHGTLNEDIPVFGGKGWGDAYQLGTSAAQSMLSARALGGLGTLVSYFGQAAASSVDDARRRGARDDEALVYGALSGIAEGLAEQINIKQLQSIGSAATMRELMQTMAKQGLSEGIEEGVTSVLNTFADNLVLQDRSLMNIRISEYMAGGMTEEEARRRGWMDAVEDTLFDMFGGFATGGVTGGVQTGINTGAANLRYGNATLDEMMALVQEGMEAPEGSAARTMAQEYEQQLFHGRELNGVQIQRLLQELGTQEHSDTEQAHEGNPMAEPEATDIRKEPGAQEVAEEPVATHQNGLQVEEEDVPDTDVGDMEEDVLASLSDLGLHEEEARVLRENFRDSGMDPGEYAIGVRTAFQYGQMGIPARELARSDSAAGSLAEYQRITAYKYGRLHGQQQAQAEQKNLAGKTVGEHRNVEFDGDWSRLNDAQMAGIFAVNALGETLGVRYRFYESYQKGKQRVYLDENGVEKNAPNGFYKDGVIHLDVNAGSDGQGTVLFTAAHEMTHFIREWSPEKFRVLADTLMEGYAGTDTSVEELISKKMASYKEAEKKLSFEQAFEEVVADSMETMLSDGSFAQRVQKLKQTDRILWEKIRDWFVSMADSIRKAYENLKPDSREGQLVAEMVDTAEKLKELFAEAAVDAAGNLQRAEKNTAGEAVRSETKYSFAGRLSASADDSALDHAMKMLDQGVDKEEVRQKTGWFRGMDGKWRYEIDDSEMKIADQIANYMRLGELVEHPKLYAAYPDLADISVVFQSLGDGVNGSYDPRFDDINLDYGLKSDPVGLKDALVHELQHAIQSREGFTRGATVGMWEKRLKQGFDSRLAADIRQARETEQELKRLQEQEPEFYRDMMELNDMTPDLPRGEIDWETFEPISEDPIEWQRYDARREELEEKYGDMKVWDMNDLLHQRERAASNQGRNATELYFDTAGEIEARDASNRRTKSEGQRKTSPPRLGNEDTVFAEGTGISADYVGKTDDGIEVYETSEKTRNLTWTERKKAFLHLMRQQYRGRTAKFIRNGHVYYAKFEYRDVSKNIYGDDKSDPKGRDAKINVGADGNIFELVENSKYSKSEIERGKTQRMHRGVKHWDYFVKTVQIDGTVFDLTANVRKKADGEFVYIIEMMENNEIEPSSPKDSQNSGRNRVPNSSTTSISRNMMDVKDDGQDYSIRDQEHQEVIQTIEQENEKLRKDVANLKELVKLQRTVTNGTKFTKTSVEAAAGLLMEKAGVSRGKQELAPILERFYEFVAKNEGYDWSDVAAQTQEAVDWLLEHRKKHTSPDDYSREILDKVRSMRIRLNDAQAAETANLYGSVNEFRKRMMGSVVISKDGTALDEAWQELAALYPGTFSTDVTDGDMPVKLAEIISSLRRNEAGEAQWRYEQEVLGQELVREVYDSYWQVSNMRTFADVKQKEIDRLKLKHFNQMDKLRTEHREKVAQLKTGHRDQIAAIRKEHREAMEKQAKDASTRYQESRKKASDSRHRSEEKQKIRIMFRELDRILNRGNKKRNVKEGMQEFAASAIASAELLFSDYIADEDLIRNGIGTEMISKEQETLSKAQDLMEQIGRMSGYDSLKQREKLEQKLKGHLKELNPVFVRERARLNKAGADRVFGDLIRAYEELKESPYSHIQMAYDDGTLALLKSLQADVGSSPVKDMSLAQLEALHKVLAVVTNKIRTANKAFADGKTMEQTVAQAAEEIRQRKIPDKKMLIAIRNLENKTGWDYEKPVYALKRIGSDAITKLFLNLMDSENTAMADVDECKTFLDQMVEKYGYNDWSIDRKLDRTFVDSTGKKFRMTTGELMSLYAYARRGDGMRHIETGGFTMEHKALTDADAAIAYKLSPDMVNAITDLLTAEQKGFVEEMQTFLSETMGAKGNEVSMKLYGIKLFGEKNYFPIHMSGAYKQNVQEAQAKQAQGFGTLSNAGFTKAQNKNATGVVVMEPFLEVWADHCNEMSRYHATVPALEDIRRAMNYSRTMDSTTDSMSLKALIENRYGKEAVQYLDNLYREANSGPVQDKLQTRGQKALGMFRKNAVAYSSSVLIQQPAAITRAYAMIPKKFFGGLRGIGSLPVGIGKAALDRWGHWQTKAYEEMRRYAPGVTIAKEIGGFDTASGSTIRSYLLDTGKNLRQSVKTEGAKGLAKGTMKLVDDNAVANLPNLMDKIAWIEIWNACKREVTEKRKDLEQGSEAFLEAAGQRFTDVIRSTQVYDSVFAKSPLLRSKNVWVQSAVSFMNEPNTAANMMEQAVRDAARGDWTQAGRTFSAVARCVIFTGVLKAVVYAFRDDEEDETFLEKYLAELAGSLVADVNPVNYIPFARDVWSVAQGYGADRTDMAIFSDILTPLNKWIELRGEDRKDLNEAELEELDQRTTEALWKTLEAGATLIRVPVKNIRREIDMVLRIVDAVWHRQEKKSGTALSIRDKVEEAMAEAMPAFLRPEGKSKGDKLYYAILEGDAVYEERLRKRYEDPKLEDEELRQALADKKADAAIRKALRERDPRIRQAAESYVRGDLKEYEALAKEVIGEGFFSQNLVRDAIRAEAEEIVDKDPEMPSGKEKGLFTGDDFTAAVLAGDYYMAKRVRDDLIATAKKNGSSVQDAEKNFQSTARSSCKELYLAGQLSDSKAKSLLETYGGKTAEEAQKTVQYWKFSMKYPKYDLSETAVSTYYGKIKASGISVAQYAEYLEKLPDQANREETLTVINSMKLTRAQKDALYRAAGYAESRLNEAPWH